MSERGFFPPVRLTAARAARRTIRLAVELVALGAMVAAIITLGQAGQPERPYHFAQRIVQ